MSENESIKRLFEEEKVETKKMSIIKDKRQYSIRIPRDFADTVNQRIGNIENFKFKFTFKIPPVKSKSKPELKGELVYEKA